MDYKKHCIYRIKRTGYHIFDFPSSQKCREYNLNEKYYNFNTVFDKPSRRGADNRCRVPVIDTKT